MCIGPLMWQRLCSAASMMLMTVRFILITGPYKVSGILSEMGTVASGISPDDAILFPITQESNICPVPASVRRLR